MEPINQSFVQNNWDACVRVGQKYGIDPIIIMSDCCYETGFGLDSTILNAGAKNNYFGLKYLPTEINDRFAIDKALVPTTEFEDGTRTPLMDTFNVYSSFEDSACAWCEWVLGISWIQQPNKYSNMPKTDPVTFFHELENRGYSTEPGYWSKLDNMRQRILEQFPGASTTTTTTTVLESKQSYSDALGMLRQVMQLFADHPEYPHEAIVYTCLARDVLKFM